MTEYVLLLDDSQATLNVAEGKGASLPQPITARLRTSDRVRVGGGRETVETLVVKRADPKSAR